MNVRIILEEIPVRFQNGSIQSINLNGNGQIMPLRGNSCARSTGTLAQACVLVPVLYDPTIDNFLTWEYVYLEEKEEYSGLDTTGWTYIGRFETWDCRYKHMFVRLQPK